MAIAFNVISVSVCQTITNELRNIANLNVDVQIVDQAHQEQRPRLHRLMANLTVEYLVKKMSDICPNTFVWYTEQSHIFLIFHVN